MACGNALHHLHSELIVIHGDIGGRENGRQLMLGGGHLIVLRFGCDAQLPQFVVQLLHIA